MVRGNKMNSTKTFNGQELMPAKKLKILCNGIDFI